MKDNISFFTSEKKDGNMAFYAGGERNAGANRRRFFMSQNIDLSTAVFLQQTHSDHIVVVAEGDSGRGSKDHESVLSCTPCNDY